MPDTRITPNKIKKFKNLKMALIKSYFIELSILNVSKSRPHQKHLMKS